MAYVKQNFVKGQILTAEHMNHIEDGIVAAADAQSLGGKAPEYYLQPRNLLDNSDFTNPVNQRGQTSYTEHWGYTIDRWYLSSGDSSGSIKATVTLTDGGLKFTPSSEAADRSALVQRLPQNALRAGVDYTFVAKKTDGDYLFGGIEDNTASYGFWQVALFIDTEVTLEWAALYEGSYTADTLPPYVPKGYAAELAQCKRYYNIIPYDMDDYYVNANTAYPSMYPVFFSEMRIVPTVTLQESWNVGSAGVSIDFITKNSLAFQAAATSSRVAWHGKIKLSADL